MSTQQANGTQEDEYMGEQPVPPREHSRGKAASHLCKPIRHVPEDNSEPHVATAQTGDRGHGQAAGRFGPLKHDWNVPKSARSTSLSPSESAGVQPVRAGVRCGPLKQA